MNKTELVNRITKQIGVPEIDTKILLEVLLNKLAKILKTGDSAEIEEIGTFHLIKGEFNKNTEAKGGEKKALIDLIAYSPVKKFDPASDEILIFNIPNLSADNYSTVDSLFTMSVGKPIIPLGQDPNADLFIPRSEIEKWRLIESKVDKLLSEASLYTGNVKPGDFIKLPDPELEEQNLKVNWIDKSGKGTSIELDELLEDDSKENMDENLSWNFGEDSRNQFSERLTANENKSPENFNSADDKNKTDKPEQEEIPELNHGINWNFGGSKFRDKLKQNNEKESDAEEFEEWSNSVINNEEKNENAKEIDANQDIFEPNQLNAENEPENSLDINYPFDDFEIPKYEVNEEEEIGNFKRVKSLNSEISDKDFKKNLKNKISWESNENDGFNLQSSDEKSKNDFTRVQSKTVEYGYTLDDLKKLNEKNFKRAETPEAADKYEGRKEDMTLKEKTDIYNEEHKSEPGEETDNLSGSEHEIDSGEKETIIDYDNERVDESIEERTNVMRNVEDKDEAIQEAIDFVTKKRDLIKEYAEPKRKKGFKIAAAVLGVIIIIVALLIKFGPNTQLVDNTQINKAEVPQSFKTVIDRTYDIPVEYPYARNDAALKSDFEAISSSIFSTKLKPPEVKQSDIAANQQADKKVISKQVEKPKEINKPPAAVKHNSSAMNSTGVQVEQYIFKYGNDYVVQISSWPQKNQAEKQVKLYESHGFDSFIETAQIPGRGTWYRVKVGNFKTLAQARNFIKGNH